MKSRRRQRVESSVPVIQIWNRLLVPLQGEVTDAQADRLFDDVLRAIQRFGAEGLVLDVSGVWLMDSHLCAILARIAAAARFMGARCLLSGLSPEVVLTLQAMDIELIGIETTLTLEAALFELGVRLAPAQRDDDEDWLALAQLTGTDETAAPNTKDTDAQETK